MLQVGLVLKLGWFNLITLLIHFHIITLQCWWLKNYYYYYCILKSIWQYLIVQLMSKNMAGKWYITTYIYCYCSNPNAVLSNATKLIVLSTFHDCHLILIPINQQWYPTNLDLLCPTILHSLGTFSNKFPFPPQNTLDQLAHPSLFNH